MSNSWFQFKQFRVEQGRSAMKVSTDACIQGAWTPVHEGTRNVLDIGAGTGLLSLMIAQRLPEAEIDAIELDVEAALDATDNFTASSFRDRLTLAQGDIASFTPNKSYDLIICNPPFFSNSLLGPEEGRNKARHTISLTSEALLQSIDRLLAPGCYASILLPVTEHTAWEGLLNRSGWYIINRLHIIPKPGVAPNRVVSLCSRQSADAPLLDELLIRDKSGAYTPEFIRLLSPFYLKL